MKKYILILFISITAFGQNVYKDQFYANGIKLINANIVNSKFESLTTTEMNAIVTPKLGRHIFNSTTSTEWYYNGVIWLEITNKNYVNFPIVNIPPPIQINGDAWVLQQIAGQLLYYSGSFPVTTNSEYQLQIKTSDGVKKITLN